MYFVTITSKTTSIISNIEDFIKISGLPLLVIGRFFEGRTTLDFIKKNKVDIVITEINLPDINGLMLMEGNGFPDYNRRFIVLSEAEEFCYEYARQAIESGVASYLLHPLSKEDLLTALNIALKGLEIFTPYIENPSDIMLIQEESNKQNQSRATVDEIYDFITQNYSEPLTISDIINQFYISESYINRLLIKYKQKSFKKILTEIRMESARKLMLRYLAMPISEVAHAVGYNDPHYFSRMYKAYTGISPSFDRRADEI